MAVVRALQKAEPVQLTFTNYKKNGEEFMNLFSMKPVYDADGEYRYTIGVQMEVLFSQAYWRPKTHTGYL